MGVRTSVEVSVHVGFGASLDDKIFDRDISALLDTLDHAVAQVITLAGAEDEYEVSLGDITQPRMLYIEADRELNVMLFGTAGDVIVMKRPIDPAASSAVDVKAYLLTTAQFASLHLTNPDATNSVNVKVLIVGDLVS